MSLLPAKELLPPDELLESVTEWSDLERVFLS